MENCKKCVVCGNEFKMTEEEMVFYCENGYTNAPKRCAVCRGSKKAIDAAVKPAKEMYVTICDACGKETQLPFKPKGDKPVYCMACFKEQKKNF